MDEKPGATFHHLARTFSHEPGFWYWGNHEDKEAKFDEGERIEFGDEEECVFMQDKINHREQCKVEKPFVCQMEGPTMGCGVGQRCAPAGKIIVASEKTFLANNLQ